MRFLIRVVSRKNREVRHLSLDAEAPVHLRGIFPLESGKPKLGWLETQNNDEPTDREPR
jgi:hypothetical protein